MKLNTLQKFTFWTAMATVVAAGLLEWLVCAAISNNLKSRESEATAQTMRVVVRADLSPEDFALALKTGDAAPFRRLWSHLCELPGLFRIKIYDANCRIAWSEEPRLIGRTYADNAGLLAALQGRVVTELGITKHSHELEEGLVPKGQILETYVPLVSPEDGTVYGAIAIYKWPAEYFASRRRWMALVSAGTIGFGLLVFLSVWTLFRRALTEHGELVTLQRERTALDAEMQAAAALQKGLLPRRMPAAQGFAMAGFLRPSREIGGDHYDVHVLPDGRIVLVVVDNEGHGIPGALLMTETHAVLHAQAETLRRPKDVFRSANRVLRMLPEGLFATAILVQLEPASRRIVYCNAGHPPGLLVRRERIIRLDAGGLPLGADAESSYDEREILLQPGDVLLLYTDGLTEAMNRGGEIFGRERLDQLLLRLRTHAPEAIIEAIKRAIDQFRGDAECHDDVAMLCLAVAGEREETAPQPLELGLTARA